MRKIETSEELMKTMSNDLKKVKSCRNTAGRMTTKGKKRGQMRKSENREKVTGPRGRVDEEE